MTIVSLLSGCSAVEANQPAHDRESCLQVQAKAKDSINKLVDIMGAMSQAEVVGPETRSKLQDEFAKAEEYRSGISEISGSAEFNVLRRELDAALGDDLSNAKIQYLREGVTTVDGQRLSDAVKAFREFCDAL